ncbi:hypothetical protein P879_11379 [Paragonimus westermani]|uniref:Uncharacterized protein n=1 Tax=Paragonimus westermani TaxID=34504 RepID=A0A8T0DAP0_9TREM|nr:hypothetical protein P879_11379 [Paragonimus westermani]
MIKWCVRYAVSSPHPKRKQKLTASLLEILPIFATLHMWGVHSAKVIALSCVSWASCYGVLWSQVQKPYKPAGTMVGTATEPGVVRSDGRVDCLLLTHRVMQAVANTKLQTTPSKHQS